MASTRTKAVKATAATAVALILSSCAGWKSTAHRTLDHIHEAGVVAREIGLPLYREKCSKRAHACKDRGDTVCDELIKCHDELNHFILVLKSIQFLFIDGKMSLSISDSERTEEILAKALALVAQIHSQLAELRRLK